MEYNGIVETVMIFRNIRNADALGENEKMTI
jgi:hypothetical protein